MKEKKRILIVAGTVLVGLIAVALLVPGDALERKSTDLSAEQVEAQRAVVEESLEAIRDFDLRGEENPRAYYNEYKILAGAYERLGETRKAREAYHKMIEYSENPESDYIALVSFEQANENYKEAQKVLQDVLAQNRESFAYWNLLIDLEKNHFGLEGDELEAKIRESIEATNRHSGSLVTYAEFLEMEKQDYQGALQLWQEAAAQNPEHDVIYSAEITRLQSLINEQD